MMENPKPTLLWLAPLLLLFAAGFALAARWDLAIDIALYAPRNPFAVWMEAFGWLPAFLPTVLLAMLWAAGGGVEGRAHWRRPLGLVLSVGAFAGLCYASYHYLNKRGWANGMGDWRSWLFLALGLGLFLWAFWWVLHQGEAGRRKLYFFALAGSLFMAANVLLANLLKSIWQRPRFDEMLAEGGDFALFQPWYLPFGPGGSSFPSGHTANACGIFMLLVLCDLYPAWNRRRKLVYLVCWVYIALMAFARISIGRHFLSDTLASAGLVALLFFILRRTQWYKRSLLHVRATPAGKAPKRRK